MYEAQLEFLEGWEGIQTSPSPPPKRRKSGEGAWIFSGTTHLLLALSNSHFVSISGFPCVFKLAVVNLNTKPSLADN